MLETLKGEKEIKVVKEQTEPTKKIKENIWSTFTELEMDFRDMHSLTRFCFEYMPSSIEMLDAKELSFSPNEYNVIINDMLAKIHELNLQLNSLNAAVRAMKLNEKKLSE